MIYEGFFLKRPNYQTSLYKDYVSDKQMMIKGTDCWGKLVGLQVFSELKGAWIWVSREQTGRSQRPQS